MSPAANSSIEVNSGAAGHPAVPHSYFFASSGPPPGGVTSNTSLPIEGGPDFAMPIQRPLMKPDPTGIVTTEAALAAVAHA
jgi:hypothetical protein